MIRPASYRAVLTYGTFDSAGPSEAAFLRQLAALGREVIVGCASDALAGPDRCRALPFAQRRRLLECNRFVSRVITLEDWDQLRTDVVNYNTCALVMPDHWRGHFDDMSDLTQVIYVPGPRPISAPRPLALAS